MTNNWYKSIFKADETKALRDELDSLKSTLSDRMDVKFYESEPSNFSGSNGYTLNGAETTITPTNLLTIFSTDPWVYSAVMAIAETIAGTPWKLKARSVVKKKVVNPDTGEERVVPQEVWTDVSGSKLFDLFQFPNKYASRSEFLIGIMIDLIVTGNAYIYLDSEADLGMYENFSGDDNINSPFGRLHTRLAKDTVIDEMYRLPAQLMQPVPKTPSEGMGIKGYMMSAAEGATLYDVAEIVHLKFPNPLSYWVGLSPLMACMMRILLDRYAGEHMLRFYKSGARLGGVIEVDKALNKEQITRLQRSFENNYTGKANFYRTLILPNGMQYKPIEESSVNSSTIELAKANREAILAVLRVPPIKVGVMDNANYANANAQLKIFYDDTIVPRCRMVTDGFNMKNSLMPDNRAYKIEFDFSDVAILQENFNEKASSAKIMIDAGLSVNEVRKRMWKLDGVEGGDKVKSIEDMNNPAPGGFFGASAPESDVTKEKSDESPQDFLSGFSGPVVTSIMNIIGRVSKGKLSAEAGKEMITAFGLPDEMACKLVGLEWIDPSIVEAKSDVTPPVNAPELAADVKPTKVSYEERVAQLTAQYMSRDKMSLHAAIEAAIEQAKLEGYTEGSGDDEPPTDPSGGGKPSLGDYVAEQTAKLDKGEPVTQELIDSIVQAYEKEHGPVDDEVKQGITVNSQEVTKPKTYSHGFTKDQVTDHWKGFIDKTTPMVNDRHKGVTTWFKSFKSAIKNQVGANIKSYGVFKSRDNDDVDEITNRKHYESLIASYVDEIDTQLKHAYEMGYADTLVKFEFQPNNEAAKKALKAYGASKVTGIMDTTLDQMNTVLTEAFEQGVSITEVAARIDEKFVEIESGRAMTIARTEVLTAVSIGQDEKAKDFKEQFPEAKLLRMWVSAQDDKVWASHACTSPLQPPRQRAWRSTSLRNSATLTTFSIGLLWLATLATCRPSNRE